MTLSEERLAIIGKNIRAARRAKGKSQAEVAEEACISTAYYCQLELGNKAPSLETLINIAESLRVSVDLLVYGDQGAAALQNIVMMLNGKSPAYIQRIENVLYAMTIEFAEK